MVCHVKFELRKKNYYMARPIFFIINLPIRYYLLKIIFLDTFDDVL